MNVPLQRYPGAVLFSGTRRALACAAALFCATGAQAAFTDSDVRRLAQLDLEQLMQIEVTSVAGVAQARIETPAALTVITADEIRRSGHRSLAEVLRLVPGMYVGRVNSSSWVVGSRGLSASSLTANRYLVLVDGRTVYDPLLSTTFWDTLDLVVDDIDRIEVIRGPGATLWGANAMNGVINVITRDARETVGTVVRAGAGDYERGSAALRHGAPFDGGAWRAWAKYARRADFQNAAGVSIEDQWSSLHGGLRVDRERADGVRMTAIAEAYTMPTAHFAIVEPVPGVHRQTRRVEGHDDNDGHHLLLRAQRDAGPRDGWSLQGYYEHTARDGARLGLWRDTTDVDYRRWRGWGDGQEAIWGVQYTQHRDRIRGSASFRFDPARRTVHSINAFVQNTSHWADDRWHLMLGSKLTHHDFVGLHPQPGVRLWFTPDATQTFWAAVSRPIRVPSRLEHDGALILSYADTGLITGQPASGVIVPLALAGDPDLPVEQLLSWEAGHRIQFGDLVTLDSTVFHNDYRRLVSVPPTIVGRFNTAGSGTTYGADVALGLRPTPQWRLEAALSWLHTEIDGPVLRFEENGTPRRQAQLRSYLDLGDAWELNAALYHVGAVERLAIEGYERLDVGVGWRPSSRMELALWGQNLTDAAHPEASGAEVPRSVHLQLSLRFD